MESSITRLPVARYRCQIKYSVLARIQTSIPLHILTDVDLVIEEVSEKKEIKREIFKKLTGILK